MDNTTIFISSSNVDQKTALGSTIELDLKTPINTRNKVMRVLSSSIWYTFPNITANLGNNKIKFDHNLITYNVVFGDGLYSLNDLQETLKEFFENSGLDSNLFLLVGDDATGKITMKVNTVLPFTVDFEDIDNLLFKTYLGFTGNLVTAINFNKESTNRANLNINNSLYIHCSISGGGVYFNQRAGSTIIAEVPLNRAPGTLMYTENTHPVVLNCTGGMVNTVRVWLTNEKNELLDTFGEEFSLVLEIFEDE